jgi:glycosyltransferase involved in cell wall biosynthesis
MDFLGLKTLTIIQYALQLIKKNHGIEIDIDKIPLDDSKTFDLYQRGDTVGTFQFESEGMQLYLRDLKPTDIEDLIAMNALYRPGPLQFIPNFIDRKHGKEKVDEYKKMYPKMDRPFVVLNTPNYKVIENKDLFREKFNIDKKKMIFLYQGGLSRNRGIEILLEAFKILNNDKKQSVLV